MIEAVLVCFGLGGAFLTVAAWAYSLGYWVGKRERRD